MSPVTCPECGDENGPFVRQGGRLLCEDCAEDGAQ